MRNFAIYMRVICILLCLTVVVGAGLALLSKKSGGDTTQTDYVQQTTESEQTAESMSNEISGSLKKGRSRHVIDHDKEAHMLYIGDKTKPAIALTFDDGPSEEPTTRILDVLEQYDARATFFTMGYKTKMFPSQFEREHALRCEVANHSYSHPKFTQLSEAKIKKQIMRTNDKIEALIGVRPKLVRPPYGAKDSKVLEAVNAPVIMWSIDTKDWKTRDAKKTIATVMAKVQDGDIILMHDVYEPTAAAVEKLVPMLINQGYQLVTVPELAILKGEKLKKGHTYNRIPEK